MHSTSRIYRSKPTARPTFRPSSCMSLGIAIAGLVWLSEVHSGSAQETPAQNKITTQGERPSDATDLNEIAVPVDWGELDVLNEQQRQSLERTVKALRWSQEYAASSKMLEQMRVRIVPDAQKPAGELELSDPATAVAFYGSWLMNAPFKTQDEKYLGVRLCSIAGQLYARDLGLPQRALEIYDWGIVRFWHDAWVVHLRLERDRLIQEQQGVRKLGAQIKAPQAIVPLGAEVGTLGAFSVRNPTAREDIKSLTMPTVEPATKGKLLLPESLSILNEKSTTHERTSSVAKQIEGAPVTVPRSAAPVSGAQIAVPSSSALAPPPIVSSIGVPAWLSSTVKEETKPVQSTFPSAVSLGAARTNEPPGAVPDVTRALQGVGQSTLHTVTMWEQLKAGNLSPETAWKNGDLNYESILQFLRDETGDWIINEREKNHGLRLRLIEVLLTSAPHILQDLTKTPVLLRLWVGDYLQSKKDQRAVPVLESILSEIASPVGGKSRVVPGEDPLVFQTLERLAWYYTARGDHVNAARAWGRVSALHSGAGWWTVHAAWGAQYSGDVAAEEDLYSQMIRSKDHVLNEIGSIGHAKLLMRQGRSAEARNALSLIKMSGTPEHSQVRLWSLMGLAHYEAGEFEIARGYIEKAKAKYSSLTEEAKRADLPYHLDEDNERLLWMSQWERQPLYAEPQALKVTLPREQLEVVSKLVLYSYSSSYSITATCDDPRVKVLIGRDRRPNDFYSQRDVTVHVNPGEIAESINTVIRVRSTEFNKTQIDVPLHIEVLKPVQISMNRIFYGLAKPGEVVTKHLKCFAESNFQIVKVESDNAAVQATLSTPKSSKNHIIELKLRVQNSPQLQEGRIRIVTDLPHQEVISLPYMAFVE